MTLIEILNEEFEKVIQTKNSWGKNEILTEFNKAWIRAMLRYAKQEKIVLE